VATPELATALEAAAERHAYVLVVAGAELPDPVLAEDPGPMAPAPRPDRGGDRAFPAPWATVSFTAEATLKAAMDPVWAPPLDFAGRTVVVGFRKPAGRDPSAAAERLDALREHLGSPYVVLYADRDLFGHGGFDDPSRPAHLTAYLAAPHHGFETVSAARAYAGPTADAWNAARDAAKAARDARPLDPATFTYADMVERLGGATKMDQFDLTADATEFRVELLNVFSKERLEADPPRLWEVTWAVTRPEGDRMTVWYDLAQDPVHHLFWDQGDAF
jgi:hypothetical protein